MREELSMRLQEFQQRAGTSGVGGGGGCREEEEEDRAIAAWEARRERERREGEAAAERGEEERRRALGCLEGFGVVGSQAEEAERVEVAVQTFLSRQSPSRRKFPYGREESAVLKGEEDREWKSLMQLSPPSRAPPRHQLLPYMDSIPKIEPSRAPPRPTQQHPLPDPDPHPPPPPEASLVAASVEKEIELQSRLTQSQASSSRFEAASRSSLATLERAQAEMRQAREEMEVEREVFREERTASKRREVSLERARDAAEERQREAEAEVRLSREESAGMVSELTTAVTTAKAEAARSEALRESCQANLKETRSSWVGSLAEVQKGFAARLVMAAWKQRVRDSLQHGMLVWRVMAAEGTVRFIPAVPKREPMPPPPPGGGGGAAEARLFEARIHVLKKKLSAGEAEKRWARRQGQLEAWGLGRWRGHHAARVEARGHEVSAFVETLCEPIELIETEPPTDTHTAVAPTGRRAVVEARLLGWRLAGLTWGITRWVHRVDRTQTVQEIQARVLSLQLEKQTYVRLFTRLRDSVEGMEAEGEAEGDVLDAVKAHLLQLESVHAGDGFA